MDKQSNYRLNVPLTALRAFEAAARHLSIKEAALELGVTPSAVSHQLRGLEDALGFSLMRRVGPALELTEAGARLAPDLSEGFSRIVKAVGSLRQDRSTGPLRLSMLPTFAAHWFSPRLTRYPFERTGFDLLISTTQEAVDLSAGVADAAVRHGQGQWDGLQADLLFEESVSLFGAPSLAVRDPDEMRAGIAGMTLFLSQYRQENYARWNATLPGGPIRPAAVMMVDSAGLALRAAMDGAGVALAGVEIAASDVSAERLTRIFTHQTQTGGGYYLVYPEALARDHRVRNLSRWMVEAAQESRDKAQI
ncbi:LysR family transcriptional regulator [Salipiger aestuarii]|uniref:LysR family transcriptional regulator n=1 Tax=Salipiger aestuarii TaxID=568098 RepID=A0A327Y3Z7_9RHOB|nr:LysR substrate-binding domain-containing protein [Salipiger aestuarii]EIE50287.1 LysR family transcriptional regulator [Citreicella sp. 357]KAB2541236.1 LysR family transcriptional regulator [Salipiger aestuarii]RAK15111.1 LysR family transcriptional regulator [Salipiger aestuarii]